VSEQPPVALRGLTKQYGRITAVDDVSLTVNEGDVFGYLGQTEPARRRRCE